jgi:hypothetical protein
MRRFSLVMLIVMTGACASSTDGATDGSSSTESEPPSTERETADEPPPRVACGTQYRPASGSAGGEERNSITVERPIADRVRDEASVSYEHLNLSITYSDDGHETPSVLVHVASSSGADVERVLYQFGPELPSFVGDQGFTGLHYAYSGNAELQWWCNAGE